MSQEDKELLLKDLCARLQYGVKCYSVITNGKPNTIGGYRKVLDDFYVEVVGRWVPISTIKPYLRPMSSMTEEEEDSLAELNCYHDNKGLYFSCGHSQNDICDVINFLNSHHFDYRGLIEKGLALEAPEGMYN